MLKSRLSQMGAYALVAAASAAFHTPIFAQTSDGARQPVRLAFGYQCGDRFLVHNDGGQPITIQYAVAGAADRLPLDLAGAETVTITSPASAPLELWVNGRVVATEPKGNRACAANTGNPGNPGDVVVRPLGSADTGVPSAQAQDPGVPTVVYGGPPPVYDYYPPYPYPYYYPPYDPYYTYGGFYPVVRFGGPFISIRGGPGFGFGRGGVVFRGRGRGR